MSGQAREISLVGTRGTIFPTQCPICCEKLDGDVAAIDCGHIFHTNCIHTWAKTKEICPICRKQNATKNLRHISRYCSDQQTLLNNVQGEISHDRQDHTLEELNQILTQLRANNKVQWQILEDAERESQEARQSYERATCEIRTLKHRLSILQHDHNKYCKSSVQQFQTGGQITQSQVSISTDAVLALVEQLNWRRTELDQLRAKVKASKVGVKRLAVGTEGDLGES